MDGFIPYQTNASIVNAARLTLYPFLGAFYARLSEYRAKARLMRGIARIVLDTRAVVWYYKGTDIEIAHTKRDGFVLLDHIRKLRSPGLNNLSDALKARTDTLKELADAPPAPAPVDQAEV